MCKYRDLNLWLPQKFTSAAWEQELQAAAGHGIRLRLLPLESCRETLPHLERTNGQIHLIGAPTDMKVQCVAKGTQSFLLKGIPAETASRIYDALWPRHSLYHVEKGALPQLRETFLPGMTTYRCTPARDGIRVQFFTIPGDTSSVLCQRLRDAIQSTGLPTPEILSENEAPPLRYPLSPELLETLMQVYLARSGRGPNFEWEQTGEYLRLFSGYAASNVFAVGPGYPADALRPVYSENFPPAKLSFTSEYRHFLKQFVQELSAHCAWT